MPIVHGIRERRDHVCYDTKSMEPGETHRFFGPGCLDRIGDLNLTNMKEPGVLPPGQSALILAIGLRILGTAQDEEDELLDYFMLEPVLGDKAYGPWPGSLCSTLRFVNEDAEADPREQPMAFLPGYVLQRPLVIPVRMGFYLTLLAARALPRACVVRAMLLTLNSRDCQ